MLARVLPLSRPLGFQEVLKTEGPKGELLPGPWKGLRCGIEPARSLDKRFEDREDSAVSFKPGEGDWKGLWDGVGREDWELTAAILSKPFPKLPAGNREGTVPARARLVEGKLSWEGP